MLKSLLAASAALLLVSTAHAADTITTIKSERFAEIVTAMTGLKATITKPEAGVELVTISDGGDVDFILSDCKSNGCSTLQPTMFFNKHEAFNLAVVNAYNSKQLGAQAFLTPDDRVYLLTLYLLDGGVTEENMKIRIALYLKTPGIFADHVLKSQVVASSAPSITQTTPAVPGALVVPTSASTTAPQQGPELIKLIERVTKGKNGHTLR